MIFLGQLGLDGIRELASRRARDKEPMRASLP
jgi:hypothetical protein